MSEEIIHNLRIVDCDYHFSKIKELYNRGFTKAFYYLYNPLQIIYLFIFFTFLLKFGVDQPIIIFFKILLFLMD